MFYIGLEVNRQMKQADDTANKIDIFEGSCCDVMASLHHLSSTLDAFGSAAVGLSSNPDLHSCVRSTAREMQDSLRSFKESMAFFLVNNQVSKGALAPCHEMKACAARVVEYGRRCKASSKKDSCTLSQRYEATAASGRQKDTLEEYALLMSTGNTTIPLMWRSLLVALSQYFFSLFSSLVASSRSADSALVAVSGVPRESDSTTRLAQDGGVVATQQRISERRESNHLLQSTDNQAMTVAHVLLESPSGEDLFHSTSSEVRGSNRSQSSSLYQISTLYSCLGDYEDSI